MFDLFKRKDKLSNLDDIARAQYSDREYYYIGYVDNGDIKVVGQRFYTWGDASQYARTNIETNDIPRVFSFYISDINVARKRIERIMRGNMPQAERVGAVESSDSDNQEY